MAKHQNMDADKTLFIFIRFVAKALFPDKSGYRGFLASFSIFKSAKPLYMKLVLEL